MICLFSSFLLFPPPFVFISAPAQSLPTLKPNQTHTYTLCSPPAIRHASLPSTLSEDEDQCVSASLLPILFLIHCHLTSAPTTSLKLSWTRLLNDILVQVQGTLLSPHLSSSLCHLVLTPSKFLTFLHLLAQILTVFFGL